MFLALCATCFVGATAYATAPGTSIRIGIFNTQSATQSFFESPPQKIGDGVNAGEGEDAARAELMALGCALFEVAGNR